jgi:predicted O-methyltransferase YrrM
MSPDGDDQRALWRAVDDVIAGYLLPEDPALDAAQAATEEAGMPAISVTAQQGKLLQLLVRAIGARQVLEVGTLGGYSTIWMARALPDDGRLVTLEAAPRHAEVARRNIAAASLDDRVEVLEGAALDTLPTLDGPFDVAFIDADKEHNADYFEWALRLVRPGGLVIVDNVVRQGQIADASGGDARVEGVRRLFAAMQARPEAASTAIQTVGAKGYDGFTLTVVPG